MNEVMAFVVQHWLISGAFGLVALTWIAFECRLSFSGVPQLSPTEATLLINREECFVVDIQDFNGYDKGHIVNAINIPLVDLNKGHGVLEAHKERPVLLVCAQGQHVQQAASILKKQGFQNVQVLKGGMRAWLNENLPVVKGLKAK